MSASVRFLRPRRMPLFVAIVPLPIGVFAIAAPPGAELVYDVAAEPKKTAPRPKGGRSEFARDCALLGGDLREMYGQESGAVILSQCTYPKGNGSAGVRTCSWTTNTCTVERVGPTLSGPRAEIDAPGVASDVAAQQSATEADKGAFAEACRTEGGQYEDLANGSFRCVTGGAETVVCDPTISLCHHVQLLSATETIKVVRPGDLPARKDVAATKPANRASGAGALAPAATPLAATPVPGSN